MQAVVTNTIEIKFFTREELVNYASSNTETRSATISKGVLNNLPDKVFPITDYERSNGRFVVNIAIDEDGTETSLDLSEAEFNTLSCKSISVGA